MGYDDWIEFVYFVGCLGDAAIISTKTASEGDGKRNEIYKAEANAEELDINYGWGALRKDTEEREKKWKHVRYLWQSMMKWWASASGPGPS